MNKTVCELFAGVGGFRLGLERGGNWKTIWVNQWEPNKGKQHAFDCYAKHFRTGKQVNEDISAVDAASIPDHTLLVGGFPCQDYSVAMTGAKGIEGKKGVLWWEIERIIETKHPPFVLLENVDRLLKSPAKQRGRDFGILLGCFRDLNYSVEWRVINAADYGFPQKRRRTFIFGFRNDTAYHRRVKGEPLSKWLSKRGFFGKVFPVEEDESSALGFDFEALQDDIAAISNHFAYGFENAGIMTKGRIFTTRVEPVYAAPCPLGSILESKVDEKYYIKDKDKDEWTYMKGAKRELRRTRGGFEYNYTEGAIPFPDPLDKPGRTMLTSEGTKNRSTHVVRDPETHRFRLLTPVETERLNGFDDDWTNTGMPESFRYFCMGNALVVGLIEKIGRELASIVRRERKPRNHSD